MRIQWFKNIFYPLALLVLLVGSSLILYLGYLLLYPIKIAEPRTQPFIVKEDQVVVGKTVTYVADVCKYKSLPAQVIREFIKNEPIGQVVVDSQEQLVSNLPTGCDTSDRSVPVPLTLSPGTYYIRLQIIYQVNHLRKVEYTFFTETFEVINPVIEVIEGEVK